MEEKKLSKKAIKFWLTKNSVLIVLMTAVYIVALVATEGKTRIALAVSFGLVFAICITLLIVFPFLKYRFYRYTIADERIYVKRGVIFRHRVIIPVCQIQDIHLVEGPIMLLFKLCGVEFSTAGSNFVLYCLDKTEAERIADEAEKLLVARLEEKRNEKI